MNDVDNVQKLKNARVLDERAILTEADTDTINGLSDQEVTVLVNVARTVGDLSGEGEGSPWIL